MIINAISTDSTEKSPKQIGKGIRVMKVLPILSPNA